MHSGPWGANWASDGSFTTQTYTFLLDHDVWGLTLQPNFHIQHSVCNVAASSMTLEAAPTVRGVPWQCALMHELCCQRLTERARLAECMQGCMTSGGYTYTWKASVSCIPGACTCL